MTRNETLETLKAARELISDEANWIQGSYALTATGQPVNGWDSAACKWCSLGAIQRASGKAPPVRRSASAALADVTYDLASCSPWLFNDNHTHAEVLAAFDQAIADQQVSA